METFASLQLKKRIMRNVYGIWLMRQAAPIVFVELPALGILGYLATKFIFIERVLLNMASSANGVIDGIRFVLMAFVNTRFETQLVLGLSLAIGLFFMKDFTRSIRGLSSILR